MHESSCDFCGTCIDVCPTATLMEHPNKWAAAEIERWSGTTCLQCSVGCTINLGTRNGRGVIIRPDAGVNPVSRDQLCVRGRFHYDAIKPSQRLSLPLIRRNGGQESAGWDEALDYTVARLAQVREEHGPEAIGFLGSPFATTEENYLVGKIGRAIVGSNNIDSSVGAVARAASESLRGSFGSEVLPADMLRLAQSRTVLVVADDLESSHNVACLRIKDAVVRNAARLIVVSARWGELNDFAAVWVRPRPGEEPQVVATLAASVQKAMGKQVEQPPVREELRESVAAAAELLVSAAREEEVRPLSVVYALPHLGPEAARAITVATANVAIACAGEDAAGALFVLPQEANVWGLRDVGVSPDLFPGYRRAEADGVRREMQIAWGAQLSDKKGLTIEEMLSDGKLKALVAVNDNPLMLAPGRAGVAQKLRDLDFLAVIDEIGTDTAQLADVVLPDRGPWSKDGTTVSADRRILRMRLTTSAVGESQETWRILAELGRRLAARLGVGEVRISYPNPGAIMDEISSLVPLYRDAAYGTLDSGQRQLLDGLGPKKAELQPVPPVAAAQGQDFILTTSRSLYTSYEGAAIHSSEADKLHREETVEVNPSDAARLGIGNNDLVVLTNGNGELAMKAHPTEAVQPGMLYVPLYYDGGAIVNLFSPGEWTAAVQVRPAAK